jgi:hypothetical protein
MRLRPLVNILAILGMLAHAGALVRHNSVMVDAAFEYQALLSDIGSFCHGDAGSSSSLGAASPGVPPPTNSHDSCAICLGLATAVALIVANTIGVWAPVETKVISFDGLITIAEVPHALHPPARGPPIGA